MSAAEPYKISTLGLSESILSCSSAPNALDLAELRKKRTPHDTHAIVFCPTKLQRAFSVVDWRRVRPSPSPTLQK